MREVTKYSAAVKASILAKTMSLNGQNLVELARENVTTRALYTAVAGRE